MNRPCIIVEDEKLAREKIALYLDNIEGVFLAGSYATAESFLTNWQSVNHALLFLDIQLPGLTGLELAAMIQEGHQIIFTTAYSEYAVEGFELEAVDYLLKPFDFKRFARAIDKAQNLLPQPDFILVKSGSKTHRLAHSEIFYIEGLREYVVWHTEKGKIVAYTSLKNILAQLAPKGFRQIHKSYIVNFSKVDYFEANSVHINGIDLPVGRTFKDQIADYLI